MYKVIFSAVTALLMVAGLLPFSTTPTPEREYVYCHPGPLPDDMAVFASDPAFQALHLSPEKINYQAKGEMIKIKTTDGQDASAYMLKAKNKSDKWLFVYQEWWGLNDQIKREADKFYDDLGGSVNVMAIDMYDGKVTTNPQEAGQFMQQVKQERLETIVKAAYAHAGPKAQVGNVGWCFGGGWSLKSAIIGQILWHAREGCGAIEDPEQRCAGPLRHGEIHLQRNRGGVCSKYEDGREGPGV